MNNIEFANKLKDIALNYKTLYVKGCFGAPLNESNKKRYTSNNSYNKQRSDIINSASNDTFGFDCICLIKGVLWGWDGNINKIYGGANYGSNNVPDIGELAMINKCSNVSTNFINIEVGEFLWMNGHCGVYIGDGLAVECSPKWKNKVQITAIGNIGSKNGYNTRTWTKHGKLPYIEYKNENIYILTRILRISCEGEDVKKLQQELINKGYSLGKYKDDGVFGNYTLKAVKKYQLDVNIKDDGEVGPITAQKLGWIYKDK